MANPSEGSNHSAKPTTKRPSVASVLVPVAGILAVVLFVLGYLRDRHPDPAAPGGEAAFSARKVGSVIDDFELTPLTGDPVPFSKLGGKVVLLNFWATWCGPCVKEMPSLQKLSDAYGKDGLVVVGINVEDDPEKVLAPFLAKYQIKFPSYVDRGGKLSDRFRVSGLPLTLVVDANRKLLLEQLGDEDWFAPALRKQFEIWLKESGK